MAIYKNELVVDRPGHLHFGQATQWIIKSLTDITVIFGRNGSGKSQLLRALRDQDRNNYHYASPERGGEIQNDPSHTSQEFDGNQRASKRQGNYSPTYRQEVISRIATYLQKRGNIRSSQIPLNPEEIEDFLNSLLPNFKFSIPQLGVNPFELRRVLPQEQQISGIKDLSSGESEVLTLGLDLLTMAAIWQLEDRQTKILLVDEPDTHLHPELQQQVAQFLAKLAEKYGLQIIIATHSTTLLSSLGFYGGEKTSIVYLDNSVVEQKATKFDDELMILSACLGGHALMGPLFSYPLALVEGDDDYKIWSEAVRHHNLKLAVIPCNGSQIDNYKSKLEKIFGTLLSNHAKPSGYVLKDRDDDGPASPSNTNSTYLKTLRLECRESENLYLTEQVLAKIGISWNETKQKIQEKAHEFGLKEDALMAVKDADRKNHDLKGLMEELSRIVDPKNVDWRLRIGQVIGETVPTGELADFLGKQMIDSLWPR